jgi:hypothetical protein
MGPIVTIPPLARARIRQAARCRLGGQTGSANVYRHRGRTVAQRFAPLDAGPFGRAHRRSHWADPIVFTRGPSGPRRFRAMVKEVRAARFKRMAHAREWFAKNTRTDDTVSEVQS